MSGALLELLGDLLSVFLDLFWWHSIGESSSWRKAIVILSALATIILVGWWLGRFMQWW